MNRNALLSVTDKTGIVEFAQGLVDLGFHIISTGGTARVLVESGIPVIPIEDVTGVPEGMDGRLKTLSHVTLGGILADRDKEDHLDYARLFDLRLIDVVVCNLYNFEGTVSRPDVTFEEAVAQIDIGGPTMIRAAAKNVAHVWVVTDPVSYKDVLHYLLNGDEDEQLGLRLIMQARAFELTAKYDTAIAAYLQKLVTETIKQTAQQVNVSIEKLETNRSALAEAAQLVVNQLGTMIPDNDTDREPNCNVMSDDRMCYALGSLEITNHTVWSDVDGVGVNWGVTVRYSSSIVLQGDHSQNSTTVSLYEPGQEWETDLKNLAAHANERAEQRRRERVS